METNDKYKKIGENAEFDNSKIEHISESERTPVVYYDTYDHGFTNGILKIPKEHFEGFIDFSAKKKLAQEELGITLHELKAQEQLLVETKEQLLQFNNTIAACEHELEFIQTKQMQVQNALQEIRQQKKLLLDKKAGINTEYNWFNAILFIVIGFVFIISDFLITWDVLHLGLNLNNGIAFVLAVAVSSISFIIKPTIDRIFEKPSLDGRKKRQNALLITVSALAIIVLGCLGFFREEYFAQKQQRDSIAKQVTTIDNDISDLQEGLRNASSRNDMASITQLSDQMTQLRKDQVTKRADIFEIDRRTKSHGILYFIFTISNVLFALAGAICLSIAFPVVDRQRNKMRLSKDIQRHEAKESSIYNTLEELSLQQKKAKDNKSSAHNSIALLPDLSGLESKQETLKKTAGELLKFAAENNAFADSALYREAYERGLICEFNEKIIITPHQIGSIIRKNTNSSQSRATRQSSSSSSDHSNGAVAKEDRYLHQQIRNLIEYNHQNKKHLLNGENV